MASVPLLSAGEMVGALNLDTQRVRAFPEEELDLLAAIGQLLGSAVHNAQLYEAVQTRTTQLEAANKELEAFSYSVSHDLRAPLRAIDGFSRILAEEYTSQLTPEAQHYFQRVRNNVQKMGQLVDDLLTLSRTGRQPLVKRPFVMSDLVREVKEELLAGQDNRKVTVSIGELPTCQADAALLKQVWVNLLSNAIKFTSRREEACIDVGDTTVEEFKLQNADWASRLPESEAANLSDIIYYVRDNGVGFDMQYIDKLFGVFQRLHSAAEYEGTGVGLAIVQRIVHRHGGHVWAEAVVNQGASFYFTLGGAQ